VKWLVGAFAVLVVALVVFAAVHDDERTRCRYSVGDGGATVVLPCGLDGSSARTYVADHPEVVTPKIPTLSAN
jgi:hypothetical protein